MYVNQVQDYVGKPPGVRGGLRRLSPCRDSDTSDLDLVTLPGLQQGEAVTVSPLVAGPPLTVYPAVGQWNLHCPNLGWIPVPASGLADLACGTDSSGNVIKVDQARS